MKKDMLIVISPIEGTPAYKAGIRAEDVIIKIDDDVTMDMSIEEAVKKIKGPKGTSVTITVMREGESQPLEFQLVRDDIPLESVRAMVLKPGFGYVRLSNFNENTTHDLKAALKEMYAQHETPLKGLILDLRDNPGGLLEQAIGVSDLFLENGTIVSVRYREKTHTQSWHAHPNGFEHHCAMVVLINGGSASASEIVAGALQDHKRALIIGTTSFGKGSVQTVKPLKSAEGYGLRYTIARYYTPDERSIQAQGIEPDLIIPHKILEVEDTDLLESGLLKEKDLKHHLAAETSQPADSDMQQTPEPPAAEETNKKPGISHQYGKLDRQTLMTDSQVRRALELLVSYHIFKKY
jgi:carboxyl-terminal processing protease